MGYTMRNGRHADTDEVVLAPAEVRTSTVTGDWVELGDRGVLRLDLSITVVSGTTPTLDVTIETSSDQSVARQLGTFSQKTGVGSERKSFAGCDRFARAVLTIGGTSPSFTASVAGEAV